MSIAQEFQPLIDMKKCIFLFLLNNLRLNKWISLKLVWYMIINKVRFEFAKGDYVSIWPGVKAPERHEKLQVFGFCSVI